MKEEKNILYEAAKEYFKKRVGFDADVKIKMNTVAVTKLMHDFAFELLAMNNITLKESNKFFSK